MQDLRYALRGMRRSPMFTAVAVATLAIGVAANTAMFSLADALVLKPLPVERPDELRAVFQVLRFGGRALKSGSLLPYSLYTKLRDHAGAFADTMAFAELDDLALETDDRRELRTNAVFVSANYLSVLGISPRRGRGFAADEDRPASPSRVLLLSDRFWKLRFDSDEAIVGRTIRVGGAPFTVIGVMPPEFFGVIRGRSPDVYLPLGSFALAQPGIVTAQNSDFWNVRVVGRLAATTTDVAAADRLTAVLQASFNADPKPIVEPRSGNCAAL